MDNKLDAKITGITPKAGQHAEYNLTWTQEGI